MDTEKDGWDVLAEDTRYPVFCDVDFDHVPFSLYQCPVCSALLHYWGQDDHRDWHRSRGEQPKVKVEAL